MENKIPVSVILPIKSSKVKDFEDFFKKAIESLQKQLVQIEELVIVHTLEESLVELLSEYDFGDLSVSLIPWEKEPNYASQVNFGISKVKSEWVSLFEFDDEYAPIWFKNVKNYMEQLPTVEMFLPVVVDVDDKLTFVGFTNEATFAANFTNEIGKLTNDTLQSYQNFQTAGSVFKKKLIEDFGGFKPSMKLTFVYEFLLRMTYNSVSITTIPRLGYKHLNLREGSIFWTYKFGDEKMLEDEVRFWIELAKKEYFFKDDRSIKYDAQNV